MNSRSGIKAFSLSQKPMIIPAREKCLVTRSYRHYIPDRENPMTAKELGEIVKKRRKSLKMNQADLALVSGTGVRFISDLENGKETCVVGKTLKVMENLGIDPVFRPRGEQ